MKALFRSWIVGMLALVMVAASLAAPVAAAQDRVQFRQEEIDQMLAPIALYPDPLLSQILMASTYPLEVVEAARWSKANPGLKGQDAVRAVESMEWDPSVKSLVAFPQVLAMMDSKLDWTESLGEAFAGQQDDVMNSIQGLRRKAEAAGNLLSSDQMTVGQDGDYITLAPPAPDMVYVPYYDPTVVYGPWWWPAYPPVYWAPPAYYVGPGFRPGFFWGSGIAISATFFFGHTDWRHRRVTVVNNQINNVTVNRTVVNGRTVIRNAPARSRSTVWQPDPAHRRGAPFHHVAARQRFERIAKAAPTVQQRTQPRSNAAPEKREPRRSERREAPQSRVPQEKHPPVIQGGRVAQPPAQEPRRAQPEIRTQPAPQQRPGHRDSPRTQQPRPSAPRPQAQSNAPRPAYQRPDRRAERHDAPRPQVQHPAPHPAPAPAAPRAPAASAPHPAPHAPARANPPRAEHGHRGNDK